jgi:hypothetical protein
LAWLSLTCFLKTTMYELGTSLDCVDDRIGAASLWMVPTCSMGEAAASAGRRDKAVYLMMAASRTASLCDVYVCVREMEKADGGVQQRMSVVGERWGSERWLGGSYGDGALINAPAAEVHWPIHDAM